MSVVGRLDLPNHMHSGRYTLEETEKELRFELLWVGLRSLWLKRIEHMLEQVRLSPGK